MKKLNRREKTYVKLAIAAILLALIVQGSDIFFASRDELASDIEAQQERLSNLQKVLENESVTKYEAEAEALVESLKGAQERVLELKSESEATSFLSKVISTRAEKAGVNINSISPRKSKLISEEKGLYELRTYFGYDCDLQALLTFFTMLDGQDFYLSLDNVNISVRRQPNRKVRNRRKRVSKRKPLNGNALLVTLFRANPDATVDRYEVKLAESDRMMMAAGLIADEDDEMEAEPVDVAEATTTIKTKQPTKATTINRNPPPLVRPQLDLGRKPGLKPKDEVLEEEVYEEEEVAEEVAEEPDDEEDEVVNAAPPKRATGGLRPLKPAIESGEEPLPLKTDQPKSNGSSGWPKAQKPRFNRKPGRLSGPTKMGN